MKNKISVTIGIPAYNEEANIEYLLRSVLAQKTGNFVLEKIIVVSDASEDKTEKIVKRLAKTDRRISLISGRRRKGKVKRMAQYFSLNKSDILFSLDADIVLGHSRVMERMVAKLARNRKVILAMAHHIPIKPSSFVGKIIYASYQLWDEIRLSISNFDHIQNQWGGAFALKRSLSERIKFPSNLTDDRGFMYIKSKEHGDFAYLLDAPVYYRPVSTIKDMFVMSRRSLSTDKDILADIFGDRVYKLYHIPTRIKFKAIVKRLIISPFFTSLTLLLNIIWKFAPVEHKLNEAGLWEMTKSTKKAIKILPQHQPRRNIGAVRGFASDNREKPRASAHGGSPKKNG